MNRVYFRYRQLRHLLTRLRPRRPRLVVGVFGLALYFLPGLAQAGETSFLQKIINVLADMAKFLKDLLLWIPKMIYSLIVDGAIAAFNKLPALEFLQGLDLSGMASIGYFIGVFRIKECLGIFVTALLARFILRRIPFIG